MNIDKSCYNSFCEPTATGRRSKKSSRIAPMHTESLTRIFLTFLLMQRDSKRICKRYRLRLLRRMKKRSSAAEGKANEELSASLIKKQGSASGGKANYTI